MYTYPVQIAITEETGTTCDGGPAALPATLSQILQRRQVHGGGLRRGSQLLLRGLLRVGLQAHFDGGGDGT